MPILTGEDIYLKEGFINLCEKQAIRKIHPDISTSGGILETHKIGERAMELGVPMAMHYAGTPVGAMASVHCAAATENFLALSLIHIWPSPQPRASRNHDANRLHQRSLPLPENPFARLPLRGIWTMVIL